MIVGVVVRDRSGAENYHFRDLQTIANGVRKAFCELGTVCSFIVIYEHKQLFCEVFRSKRTSMHIHNLRVFLRINITISWCQLATHNTTFYIFLPVVSDVYKAKQKKGVFRESQLTLTNGH